MNHIFDACNQIEQLIHVEVIKHIPQHIDQAVIAATVASIKQDIVKEYAREGMYLPERKDDLSEEELQRLLESEWSLLIPFTI